MFKKMRRKKQLLSFEEITAVLHRGTSGVLALSGDDDYPYAVPISYVYDDNKIYFHCAKSGHKMDAIHRNPKASFCIIDQDKIIPEDYTTNFRSVIIFGQIRVVDDEQDKRTAIEKIAVKYAPEDTAEGRNAAILREWKPLCVIEMSIDHMTGKESIELVKKKEQDNKI